MKTNCFVRNLLIGGLCCLTATLASAQTIQKVTDLISGQGGDGAGYGPNTPECHLTLVGTNFWFTSNLGGLQSGGVFSLDLSSSNVTQLATLDTSTGDKPWSSSIVIANGRGWFTTSTDGAGGGKGTLCSIDLTNYAVTRVYSFPTNADYGWNPHSTPIQIGNNLWFTTSAGGLNPDGTTAYGTIVKYGLLDNTLTNMFTLSFTNSGRQPLANSLVKAGDAYYYLTSTGGTNVTGGNPNGSGVLGKLTFDSLNQPHLTKLYDLPGGFASLPFGDVVYDGTNFLYFNTVGIATNPGALVKFDIAKNQLTTLFTFITNATAVTNFGKQPYGTPVLYNNELYFTTFAGGTLSKGVLDKFNLTSNTLTKLADFDGATGLALGASPMYCGGTLYTDPLTGRNAIYFPINKGGLSNNGGTIIKVVLPPLPIAPALQVNGDGNITLSWSGGYAPFNVDMRTSLTDGAWTTNWLSNVGTNSVILPASNNAAFFRIQGASQ